MTRHPSGKGRGRALAVAVTALVVVAVAAAAVMTARRTGDEVRTVEQPVVTTWSSLPTFEHEGQAEGSHVIPVWTGSESVLVGALLEGGDGIGGDPVAKIATLGDLAAVNIRSTIDRSARWRALHDGPLANTTDWKTIDPTPGLPGAVSVPSEWPVHRVGEEPNIVVPWRCTDGFADSNAKTVVVDEQPSTMVEAGCGAPVGFSQICSSLPDS